MADGPVRDFLSTASGDWAVVNGDFAPVAGSAAVQQGVRIRVRAFLGEIFLDESQGIDYRGVIFVKNPDPLHVRAEVAAAIADTPDVTDVIGAGMVGPDAKRKATLRYQIATAYSQNPVVGQVEVP